MNKFFVITFLALAAAGCSTPPEAIQQTKLTISVLTEYQEAAESFKTEHARSTAYLSNVADGRKRELEGQQQFVKDRVAIMKGVGDPAALEVHARIATLMATLAQNSAARHTAAQLRQETGALLKPLPSTTEASDETKKALGKLLDGVPNATRLEELQGFYNVAKESLKEAKKKLEEPPAAASAPN